MLEILHHTLIDTLKTVPILFIVYLIIEYLEARVNTAKMFGGRLERFGPIIGALAGCVPQCGFSAAAASLYNERILSAGTLAAVFLATSDEAIPIMLAKGAGWKPILLLLVSKMAAAVFFGYLLKYTVFRRMKAAPDTPIKAVEVDGCGCCDHSHHGEGGKLGHICICALKHTLQIALFIAAVMFCINAAVHWAGEERLQAFLLSGSIFQPVITALIGLIPGCATSVLLTELYLGGSISFGAAVAGLATGAGFGYLVLFRGCRNRLEAVKIVGWVYVCAAVSGMVIQLFA